ncbi:tripartite tricarboxylate transporter substrate binding protein [Alcaligenaceae bacterium]|nr:tripartite tricarboxylate transporter substrate binding protein [Alcaligenaceae bacterium]
MKTFVIVIRQFIMALTVGCVSFSVQASQPVRLQVGFSPGGTTDIIARLVADGMSKQLGRDIIVENRPGASGNIAAAQVAEATADGHTMLFAPSSHATNATLYKTKFNTEKDFSAVGLVASTPYVLVVHPSLPVHTVADLIGYLKDRPGELAYASASVGTAQHLAGEMFKEAAGVDMLHVPYKGSAAAFSDLAAGRTPIMFDNIAVVLPHIKSGAVRALAVTSAARSPLLADVPTVMESGLSDFEISGWFALLVPQGTQTDVIGGLNSRLNDTINEPAFRERLQQLGAEIIPTAPQEADSFISDEIAKWRDVIHSASIAVD